MRTMTVSLGWITTQAFTSGVASCANASCRVNGKPMARPPVAAAEVTIKVRRFIFMRPPLCLGSVVNRRAHFLERAATADVGDRRVDVGVGRLGLLREERGRGHDHPALAVAALRHLVLDPRPLHLVQTLAGG